MEIEAFIHKEAVDKIVENINASEGLIKTAIEFDVETFEEAQAYVNTWKLYDEVMMLMAALRAKTYETCNFIIKNIANGNIEILDNGYDDIRELMQHVIDNPSEYKVEPFHVTGDGCCVFAIRKINQIWRLELSNDLKKLINFEHHVLSS